MGPSGPPALFYALSPAAKASAASRWSGSRGTATGSPRARRILADFGAWLPKFKKVLPRDYDRMRRAIARFRAEGMDEEQARVEAFCACTGKKGGA